MGSLGHAVRTLLLSHASLQIEIIALRHQFFRAFLVIALAPGKVLELMKGRFGADDNYRGEMRLDGCNPFSWRPKGHADLGP